MKMMECQMHRDQSPAVMHVGTNFAMGMSNRHDTSNGNSQEPRATAHFDIHAFVDGIVLNAPRHQRYFENIGDPIRATGSAIIAAAYRKWSLKLMDQLEGEFSGAIWDNTAQKLILIRDPYGHKPLHYYHDDRQFIFSSEIKGILAAPIARELDLVHLSDFLSLNCVPCPGTMFKNIFQVPPGCLLVYEKGKLSILPYWSHRIAADDRLTIEEAAAQLTERIRDAVKKRMVTNQTYCFLSGGIDSSAVVSFAAEMSSKPIQAISIGFREEEWNELEDATVMAQHVGAEHHQLIAEPASFFEMLDLIVFHHDAPFTDTSAYPTYVAAKLARQFTDVILTGDGPDQTMGGSGHHVFAVQHHLFKEKNKPQQTFWRINRNIFTPLIDEPLPSIISKIARYCHRNSLTPVQQAYELRSYFPEIVKKFLSSADLWEIHSKNSPYRHPEAWFSAVPTQDDINKYLYADMKFYITDDLMIKVDRMSMAHGLETLSPFQDRGIAQLVNHLPGAMKIHIGADQKISTKHILKKVCQQRFPEKILQKKKQGFGIPIEKWFQRDNYRFVKEILLDERTLKRNYFDRKAIQKMVQTFISDKGDYFYPNPHAVVALLTLELWHRRYLD